MIIRDKDSSYVPEVASRGIFGYRYCFNEGYTFGINGSAVGKYIKRNK